MRSSPNGVSGVVFHCSSWPAWHRLSSAAYLTGTHHSSNIQPIGLNITNIGNNLPVGIIFKWEWLLNYYGASGLLTENGIITLLTSGELLALVATVIDLPARRIRRVHEDRDPAGSRGRQRRKRQVPGQTNLRISPADDPGQGFTGERAIDR